MAIRAVTLPPIRIVDTYVAAGDNNHAATLTGIYDVLKEPTTEVLAQGARFLALLWDSAWAQGRGKKLGADVLVAQQPNTLRTRYVKHTFVPSLTLDLIDPALKKSAATAAEWEV